MPSSSGLLLLNETGPYAAPYVAPTAPAGTRFKTLADTFGSRLGLWLDAQDDATLTKTASSVDVGQAISAWADKSVSSGARTGTDYPATQATGTLQPGYTATGLNGFPALTCRPDYGQYLANTALATTQPFTIIAVFQRQNVYNGGYTGLRRLIGSNADYTSVATTNLYINVYNQGWGPTDTVVNDPRIAAVTFNAGNTLVADGTVGDLSAGGNGGTSVLAGINIGATSGGSEAHDGLIGEVAVIVGAATLAEIQEAMGVLAWKWGYQARLPAGHPYKAAAPTVAVTGTGPSAANVSASQSTSAPTQSASTSANAAQTAFQATSSATQSGGITVPTKETAAQTAASASQSSTSSAPVKASSAQTLSSASTAGALSIASATGLQTPQAATTTATAATAESASAAQVTNGASQSAGASDLATASATQATASPTQSSTLTNGGITPSNVDAAQGTNAATSTGAIAVPVRESSAQTSSPATQNAASAASSATACTQSTAQADQSASTSGRIAATSAQTAGASGQSLVTTSVASTSATQTLQGAGQNAALYTATSASAAQSLAPVQTTGAIGNVILPANVSASQQTGTAISSAALGVSGQVSSGQSLTGNQTASVGNACAVTGSQATATNAQSASGTASEVLTASQALSGPVTGGSISLGGAPKSAISAAQTAAQAISSGLLKVSAGASATAPQAEAQGSASSAVVSASAAVQVMASVGSSAFASVSSGASAGQGALATIQVGAVKITASSEVTSILSPCVTSGSDRVTASAATAQALDLALQDANLSLGGFLPANASATQILDVFTDGRITAISEGSASQVLAAVVTEIISKLRLQDAASGSATAIDLDGRLSVIELIGQLHVGHLEGRLSVIELIGQLHVANLDGHLSVLNLRPASSRK